ncbi:MAG: Gldg family protein [bacterium]
MRTLYWLARKELSFYFSSLTAQIYLICFLVLNNWLFFRGFFLENQANLRSFFTLQPWLLVFFLPAVGMSFWSEERDQGTRELLFTLPVSDRELITGKLLGGYLFFLISLLLTVNIPWTVGYLGSPDWGPVIGGYLGLLTAGAAYLAIAGFAAAIAGSQLAALILGSGISLLLQLIGENIFLFNLPAGWARFLKPLSLGSHLSGLSRGVIDLYDMLYFLILAVSFGGLSLLGLRLQRSSRKRRPGVWVAMIALGALTVTGLIAGESFLSRNLPRFDLTARGEYSLSPVSVETARRLSRPVKIYAYFSSELPVSMLGLKRKVQDLLAEFRHYGGDNLIVEFQNPDNDAALQKHLQKVGIPKVQLSVYRNDTTKIKNAYLGIELVSEKNRQVLPVIRDSLNLEYDITASLKKLGGFPGGRVAFLAGHGERDIDDEYRIIAGEIKKVYPVQEVDYSTGRRIAEDAKTLIIAGPRERIPQEDLYRIDQFLMRGGNLVFLLDQYRLMKEQLRTGPVEHGLDELLAFYGVRVNRNLVSDQLCASASFKGNYSRFRGPYPFWPKVMNRYLLATHPALTLITSFVLPWSSSLSITEAGSRKIYRLATTSPFALLKKGDHINLEPARGFNPHGTKRTIKEKQLVMALLEGSFASFFQGKEIPLKGQSFIDKSVKSRILVIGTSALVTNNLLAQYPGNKLPLLNLLDWMNLGEELIRIRSKGIIDRPLVSLKPEEKNRVRLFNTLGGALLISGAAFFLRKKW